MDTSEQVSVIPNDREISGSAKRLRRSVAEKRRMVEETLAPGASVARVATWSQCQPGVWLAQAVPGRKARGAEAEDEVAAGACAGELAHAGHRHAGLRGLRRHGRGSRGDSQPRLVFISLAAPAKFRKTMLLFLKCVQRTTTVWGGNLKMPVALGHCCQVWTNITKHHNHGDVNGEFARLLI